MNVLDTILLLHFGLSCHLVSAENQFTTKNRAISIEVMVVLPLLCCVLFLQHYGVLCQQHRNRNDPDDDLIDYHNPPSIQQVLIMPKVIENSYGSLDYTA